MNSSDPLSKKFTFALSEDLYNRLHTHSRRKGKTPGKMVRDSIEEDLLSSFSSSLLPIPEDLHHLLSSISLSLNLSVESSVKEILISKIPEWLDRVNSHQKQKILAMKKEETPGS